jgi:Iodothyronine deiodinase
VRLNEAYENHKDRMHFYCIYVKEAHPDDGWQVRVNLDSEIVYDQPSTIEQRAAIAEACQLDLRLKMPVLLGDIEDQTDLAYAARPVRLFVLDENGVIVHRSGIGPSHLDVDGALAAIEKITGA